MTIIGIMAGLYSALSPFQKKLVDESRKEEIRREELAGVAESIGMTPEDYVIIQELIRLGLYRPISPPFTWGIVVDVDDEEE